jgi:23S rRNA pseudouridine2605 synthase
MRLQKYLARSGAAPSRRKAEALISAGRVRVDGVPAGLGTTVTGTEEITLDGKPVRLPDHHTYLALNKPAGYLTALDDPGGRPTVRDLAPPIPGLVHVGRLDRDTSGLLLLTTDGELANRVAHPSFEIEKEYRVMVPNPAPDAALEALAAGPELDDGPTRPMRVSGVRRNPDTTTFRLTTHEGRNRIVRRACAAVGLEVAALERVRVGPVRLGDLKPGEHRPLTPEELEALR